MMMKALSCGGMDVLSDGRREADVDNPNGYYEYENVKRLPYGDSTWLEFAKNRVVKIVAPILPFLPSIYTYKVILMQRPVEEIVASQLAMLSRRNRPISDVDQVKLKEVLLKESRNVVRWIEASDNVSCLGLWYHDILSDPSAGFSRVKQFLDYSLDIQAMVDAVDPKLYRNRILR